MVRLKDENKRTMIMQSAKMLFAQKGFFNTSISDIVKETGLPVGSIYTYFKSKDEIVQIIVEEGWSDLYNRLMQTVGSGDSGEAKLKAIIEKFIPEVLNDLDLINILLSEAIVYTKIEEKVETLSTLIYDLIKSISKGKEVLFSYDKKTMETALVVYFLGILNAVKIARSSSINIKISDIINFIKLTVEYSMNLKL